jgi:protease-4
MTPPAAETSPEPEDTYRLQPGGETPPRPTYEPPGRPADRPVAVVEKKRRQPARRWLVRLLALALLVSLVANGVAYFRYQEYFDAARPPEERFLSGNASAEDKIAVIRLEGVIMPPFTDRVIKMIERARKDEAVKGVLLAVDSPGGLVADSHQIYHRLTKLRETGKPVWVCMKRIAASGGYYVSMGCGPKGRIFAEPTTWTGSIGVIIPRYDVSDLAAEWHVRSDPIKTGRFKDALSPFREMTPEERELWGSIVNESFRQFLTVIEENRPSLKTREREAAVAEQDPNVVPHTVELVHTAADGTTSEDLATGRIFTAADALRKGLVDEVGFEDDAVEALRQSLKLEDVRVVTYEHPTGLLDFLLGGLRASEPENMRQSLYDAAMPRAMYYFSWIPPEWPLR